MRLLKAVLSLILSLCLLWGITVTLGPTIIGFIISRSFGEQQIRLTGLAISPKLEISASRAEFDFGDNGQSLYGAIRAPRIKISPSLNGWLVQVSSGLLQVNDTINLSSLKADFRTASITNIYSGKFSFTAPEFAADEDFKFSDIKVSSGVDLSSSDLHNLTFSAQKASISDRRNGDTVLIDVIDGSLVKFLLRQHWQSQPLVFELSAKTSQVQSDRFGKFNIQSLLLEAKNDGAIVDTILMVDILSVMENGSYLKGIKANPSIDINTLKFQRETRVEIEQGRFERTKPNRVSGNLKALDVVVGLHLPERFFQLGSNISDLEIWNDQFPVITVPELAIDTKAIISPLAEIQNASAQFKAVINSEYGPVITGELTSHLSNLESQDCLTKACVASNILLGLKYEFEGEQIIVKGSCLSGQCDNQTFALTVKTSNTSKVVMGLTKQKIVNPIALIVFAGGIIQGEEVGLGHKADF
jgi:hypothetical protein